MRGHLACFDVFSSCLQDRVAAGSRLDQEVCVSLTVGLEAGARVADGGTCHTFTPQAPPYHFNNNVCD